MKKLPLFTLSIVVLLGTASQLRAQGGPPFITDDPGTPGDGHWEVNVAWTHEHRSGETVDELPLLDFNYGVGDRIQLKYEVPYIILHEDGADTMDGLGNSEAGVKWRFYDSGESGLTMSTYPQFEFRNPSSNSVAHGLLADENTFNLPLQFQKEAGGWGINVEVGAVFPSKSDNGWTYGVVVGHELNERFEIGAELHGEADSSFEHTELAAVVGLRCKLNEHFYLLASIGRELHNHFEEKATMLSYLAVQWLR